MLDIEAGMKRRQNVKRVAIITTRAIVADCPIEATCMSTLEAPKRTVRCDYYQGSATGRDGSRVYCQYHHQGGSR